MAKRSKFTLKDTNKTRQLQVDEFSKPQQSTIGRRRKSGYSRSRISQYTDRLREKYGRTTETGWNYRNAYLVVVQEESGKKQVYPVLTRRQYRTLEDADKGAREEIKDVLENQKEQSDTGRGKYPEGDVVTIERRVEVLPRRDQYTKSFRGRRFPRGTFSPKRTRRPFWYRLPKSQQAPGIPRK
jgi:hypothetical protein